jgi:hypothetical protein
MLIEIPGVVEYEWLFGSSQRVEIYALHKLAVWIVDPGEAGDLGQIHH